VAVKSFQLDTKNQETTS